MGPDRDVADIASAFIDSNKGLHYWNLTGAGKVNFVMLEHEFWIQGNTKLMDSIGFINSNYVLNGLNFNRDINISSLLEDMGVNNRFDVQDAYFFQLKEDHHELLNILVHHENSAANTWKVFDYIRFFKNIYRPDVNGNHNSTGINYYSAIDFSNPTGGLITKSEADWRRDEAYWIKQKTDAVFVGFPRNTSHLSGSNPFDLHSTGSDFSKVVLAFNEKGPIHDEGVIIPLHYGESTRCDLGTVGNNNPGHSFLGQDWLFQTHNGTLQTLQTVEELFVSEYDTELVPEIDNNCPNCKATDIRIAAMAWYQLGCINEAASTRNFTASIPRASCGANPVFVIGNDEFELTNYDAYPNPVVNKLIISSQDMHMYDVRVYSLMGSLIFESKNTKGKSLIDFENHPEGIYVVEVTGKNYTNSFKIIKQ